MKNPWEGGFRGTGDVQSGVSGAFVIDNFEPRAYKIAVSKQKWQGP